MISTTYAADRTALLIVDPYNDFMSEGGKLYEATRETAEAVGFYDNKIYLWLSHPSRVRGLKRRRVEDVHHLAESHLVWVRGLIP
jgi:hypothetical protein